MAHYPMGGRGDGNVRHGAIVHTGYGVQGVWAMGPMGNGGTGDMGYRGMGYMGNRAHGQ